MKGWIKIHRSLLEHWLWRDLPFSRGQAWVDLILLANHSSAKKMINSSLYELERGTVARSISQLAERWGWDRRKVKRFLTGLELDGMLHVNSTTNGTIITLVNYDFFQSGGTGDGTSNAQPTVQAMHSRWYTYKNVKNVKNIYSDREGEHFSESEIERVMRSTKAKSKVERKDDG